MQLVRFVIIFALGCIGFELIVAIVRAIKERKYEKEQEKRLHERYFD